MKWQFNFKHADVSPALQEYTQEQFEKLTGYLLKESNWQIYYNIGRYDFTVDVIVSNPNGRFKASGTSVESLYAAVDEVAYKLGRQFLKTKEKMQHHKKYERTKQARMERLNSLLEYDNSPFPTHNKKTA